MSGFPSASAVRPNKYHEVNSYRKTVLSDRGPSQHGSRLVILAILQYAGPGLIAFPSQETIAKDTGFCVRSVRKYAKAAERERWCTCGHRRLRKGHQWYQTIYMLHTPEQAAEYAATNAKGELEAISASQEAAIAD